MPSIKEIAFTDLDQELASTRRVLESVPEENVAWRPHEKSRSLGSQAWHLADLVYLMVMILQEDGLDLANVPPAHREPPPSRQEILDHFDRNAALLRKAIEAATDEQLRSGWPIRLGEHVIASQPRYMNLRTVGISHLVHHRGQFTVYLRLLNTPVPGLYGPSADE